MTTSITTADNSIMGTEPPKKDIPVEPEPKTYVDGKYKSDADLEKAYTDLASQHGTLSNEAAKYRKQVEELQGQLESQPQVEVKSQPTTDFEAMQAELFKKFEDGDISDVDYARESNSLTAQMVQEQSQQQLNDAIARMEEKTQNILADRDRQDVINKFYESNEGFEEAQVTGKLDAIKAENPLFDDVAAYLHLQNQGLQQQLADAKLAQGAKDAGSVLQDSGASMKTPKAKLTGEAAIKASMLQRALET